MGFLQDLKDKFRYRQRKPNTKNIDYSPAKPSPAYIESAAYTTSSESVCLTHEEISSFQSNFEKDQKNILAQTVLTKSKLRDVLINNEVVQSTPHEFNIKIKLEGNITDQMQSGRCWIFGNLNVLRLPVMKKFNLETFELSQNYLFFFDKLEKANFFLQTMIDIAPKEIETTSRLVATLLEDPFGDGGVWQLTRNIVEKYGIVPKEAFPETAHSSNTEDMNLAISRILRGYAMQLRAAIKKNVPASQIQSMKSEMLNTVYRMMVILLGTPPKVFDWSFRCTKGKFHSIKGCTPLQFYKENIEEGAKMKSQIDIVNDPRFPYYTPLEFEYFGNVYEKKYTCINVPIEVLKEVALDSLKNGVVVSFGCDVDKSFDMHNGIMDLNAFNTALAFDVDLVSGMDKKNRVLYGDSTATHDMVLTGVHVENDRPVRWRVENSWGVTHGKGTGFEVMSDSWFDEFVFGVVVDEELLKKEHLKRVLNVKRDVQAIVIPRWDPFAK